MADLNINISVPDISETLQREFECPICTEMMEPPILQCRNGHTICSTCLPKLAFPFCPKCRVSVDRNQPIRNRFMESLMEISGIKYPCENRDAGCNEVFPPGSLKREHQLVCKYRQIACPIHAMGVTIRQVAGPCNKRMPVGGIVEHTITDHGGLQYACPNGVSTQLAFKVAARGAAANWYPIVLNSTAILFAFLENNDMKLFIRRISTFKISYRISIFANERQLSYGGPCYFIDRPAREEYQKGDYLYIPEPLLNQMTIDGTADTIFFDIKLNQEEEEALEPEQK